MNAAAMVSVMIVSGMIVMMIMVTAVVKMQVVGMKHLGSSVHSSQLPKHSKKPFFWFYQSISSYSTTLESSFFTDEFILKNKTNLIKLFGYLS